MHQGEMSKGRLTVPELPRGSRWQKPVAVLASERGEQRGWASWSRLGSEEESAESTAKMFLHLAPGFGSLAARTSLSAHPVGGGDGRSLCHGHNSQIRATGTGMETPPAPHVPPARNNAAFLGLPASFITPH